MTTSTHHSKDQPTTEERSRHDIVLCSSTRLCMCVDPTNEGYHGYGVGTLPTLNEGAATCTPVFDRYPTRRSSSGRRSSSSSHNSIGTKQQATNRQDELLNRSRCAPLPLGGLRSTSGRATEGRRRRQAHQGRRATAVVRQVLQCRRP